MKRLLIPLALCLSLTACLGSTASIPTSPSAVADKTTLDEEIGLGATVAYRGAVAAARLANQIRPFNAATKARAAELDNQAFAAIKALRTAYEAGNASDYRAAATKARALSDQILDLVN